MVPVKEFLALVEDGSRKETSLKYRFSWMKSRRHKEVYSIWQSLNGLMMRYTGRLRDGHGIAKSPADGRARSEIKQGNDGLGVRVLATDGVPKLKAREDAQDKA